MRHKGITEGTVIATIFIILMFILPAIWVARSHMEAKAYNNVTGANVSTWDAMWIDVEVIDGLTKEKQDG